MTVQEKILPSEYDDIGTLLKIHWKFDGLDNMISIAPVRVILMDVSGNYLWDDTVELSQVLEGPYRIRSCWTMDAPGAPVSMQIIFADGSVFAHKLSDLST